MPYSTYASGDGSSWTAVMDPSMIAASFGFPGSNVMPGQYIVGSEMIWNQDPLLMGYQFLNPVQLETVSDLQIDQNSQTDSVGQITPAFSSMSVNGSAPGFEESVPITVIPTTLNTDGGAENNTTNSAPTTSSHGQSSAPQPEKPKSWAAIASQPAKPRPPPPPKPQLQTDIPTIETGKKPSHFPSRHIPQPNKATAAAPSDSSCFGDGKSSIAKKVPAVGQQGGIQSTPKGRGQHSGIVGKLHSQNKYNPSELTLNLVNARYFVIKSYAEDDIHRSIKYNMWTSTEHGNRRLDQAFKEQKGKPTYLFYSVNGSGHFCGMAQMMSEVDFNNVTGVWAQDKWKGRFDVKWLYVKDVPNSQLRHIRLENNENKPVTNSRDTQEIPGDKGKQVVKIVHSYLHTTSIFDDFEHYEKKQLEDSQKR